ncbi:1-phosphofructokinase family hexose kinase [Phaeovulum sp.]|uniref:1-phosphofructokinase family hexose kinase n=1 Tax=Phaeovulum sp. TaxID=2934796 RepID=UPI0039E27761
MTAILTITLNPTVDISTQTDMVKPNQKLRCTRPKSDPGGGGINVSRAITLLGGHSTAFVAVGGPVGDKVIHLLTKAGIGLSPFPAPGETRQSFSVIDDSTGQQYRFVLPGPLWPAHSVTDALSRIARAAPRGGLVVLSGSQPPGVPVDFPARLSDRITRTHARLILDTSGKPLHHLCSAGARPAHVLRMDEVEAEGLANAPLTTRDASASFAQSLVHRGLAQTVIVARGADGSVMATADQRWHCAGANVPVVSKVGAGDSFVGAFTLALSRDHALPRALQLGVAAASAAVMTEATQLCRPSDVRRLTPQCPVTKL